jgi:hypothetical protein
MITLLKGGFKIMKIIDDTKYEWMMKMIDQVPEDNRLELEYRPSWGKLRDQWKENVEKDAPEIIIAIMTLERFRDFALSSCKGRDSLIGNLELWIDKYQKEFNELNEVEED